MSIERARDMRKRMPLAEARLWNLLRGAPFKPFHFRRQVPIGPYYADFASHGAKLVIEVDGDTHGTQNVQDYDKARDNFIKGEGYEVMRFSNVDVAQDIEGVGVVVLRKLENATTRPGFAGPFSPRRGERLNAVPDSNSKTGKV